MTREELKVLICDDSILARKMLKDTLAQIGCTNFIEAKNGVESVEMFMSENPDLVLLDIVMPGKNGVEVTKVVSTSHMWEWSWYVRMGVRIGKDRKTIMNDKTVNTSSF